MAATRQHLVVGVVAKWLSESATNGGLNAFNKGVAHRCARSENSALKMTVATLGFDRDATFCFIINLGPGPCFQSNNCSFTFPGSV